MIGVKSNGIDPLPNVYSGIILWGRTTNNTVGPGNQIWYNGSYGVQLVDSLVYQISITRNSIAANNRGGIMLGKGANNQIDTPLLTDLSPLSGMAAPNSTIEIFSDSSTQGRIYEGTVSADESGNWTWDGTANGPNVTVTATDLQGNTSEFSESLVIPVEFMSFTGYWEESGIMLEWTTGSESNNYGFEIEKRLEGNAFIKIGFIKGSGTTFSAVNYKFKDVNVDPGRHYYRLKQIDSDGQITYSKIISVDVNVTLRYNLFPNYPNPFNPTTTIQYDLSKYVYIEIVIIDRLGRYVRTLIAQEKPAGHHQVTWNGLDNAGNRVASGVYLYRMTAEGYTETRKLLLIH
jgi:hypothetical protein